MPSSAVDKISIALNIKSFNKISLIEIFIAFEQNHNNSKIILEILMCQIYIVHLLKNIIVAETIFFEDMDPYPVVPFIITGMLNVIP